VPETSRDKDCVFISYKIKEVFFTVTKERLTDKVCLLSKNLITTKD